MMGAQDYAVTAIAAAALGWLVLRRLRRKARPTPMCGDCPGCAPSAGTPAHHAGAVPGANGHQAFIPVSELRAPDA